MIRADIDLRDLDRGLEGMRRNGNDVRPVFRALRPVFRKDQQAHFTERRGPFGSWAPRSAASVRRILVGNVTRKGKVKKRAQRRIENQLGRLKTALSATYNAREMVIASKVSWAGIHQFGGVAGRGAHIPARPFLWISDEFAERFAEAYREWVRTGFIRG